MIVEKVYKLLVCPHIIFRESYYIKRDYNTLLYDLRRDSLDLCRSSKWTLSSSHHCRIG